ncbi:MAG: hypothetical protein AAGL24_28895 [Pseudomonadota bacterium]
MLIPFPPRNISAPLRRTFRKRIMDHYRADPRVRSVAPDLLGSLGFTIVRTDASFTGVDLRNAYDYLCAAEEQAEVDRRMNQLFECKPGLDDLLIEPYDLYPVLRRYTTLGRETPAFEDALRKGTEAPQSAVRQIIRPFAGDLVWFLQWRTPTRFASARRGLLAHYGIGLQDAWEIAFQNLESAQAEIEISKYHEEDIYEFTLPGFPGLAPAILDCRQFLDWFIEELKLDGLWLAASTRNTVLACNRIDRYDVDSALNLALYANGARIEDGFPRSNALFQYELSTGAEVAFRLCRTRRSDHARIALIGPKDLCAKMLLDDPLLDL